MKTLTAIILSVLVGCGSSGSSNKAFASDYVPVHLYVVRDAEALSSCQIYEAWAYAEKRFAMAGISAKAVSLTEVTLKDGEWKYELDNQSEKLWEAQKWLNKNNRHAPWAIHYWFYPPIHHDGMKLFGGMAQGICDFARGGVAIGQSGAWSSHNPPLPRIDASGMIAAHEIGHLIGASHLDAPVLGTYPINIMDSAAGRFIDAYPLWFLEISRVEMYQCMGRAQTRSVKQCRRKFRGKPIKKRRCVRRVKKNAPVLRSGNVMTDGDLLFY